MPPMHALISGLCGQCSSLLCGINAQQQHLLDINLEMNASRLPSSSNLYTTHPDIVLHYFLAFADALAELH